MKLANMEEWLIYKSENWPDDSDNNDMKKRKWIGDFNDMSIGQQYASFFRHINNGYIMLVIVIIWSIGFDE